MLVGLLLVGWTTSEVTTSGGQRIIYWLHAWPPACSECTHISRFSTSPVATTRCPTYFRAVSGSASSTSSSGAGRFLRKPERQLRAFGRLGPSVSVSRKRSPSMLISRQPVMVTGVRLDVSAFGVDTAADVLVVAVGATMPAVSSAPVRKATGNKVAVGGIDSVGDFLAALRSEALLVFLLRPRGALTWEIGNSSSTGPTRTGVAIALTCGTLDCAATAGCGDATCTSGDLTANAEASARAAGSRGSASEATTRTTR